MYTYKIKVTRVVDGDTVDAQVDLGFNTFITERIRLWGIDTPESRTRNKKEKALGLKAKKFLQELVKEYKGQMMVRTSKDGKGKFGRILGDLIVPRLGEPELSFNQMLKDAGHARGYFGGSKGELGPWTKETEAGWWRWTASGYVEYDS